MTLIPQTKNTKQTPFPTLSTVPQLFILYVGPYSDRGARTHRTSHFNLPCAISGTVDGCSSARTKSEP